MISFMTKELRKAIEIILSQIQNPKKVLEVGSRSAINQEDICNLRPLLVQSQYLGVDMQKGPGVDLVADATQLPFPDQSFDLVMCFETLEHADNPWKIVAEIERVCKKNGIIILSSQQNFPLHMHPSDYFRYTPYGLSSLLKSKSSKLVLGISPPFDHEVELNPKHVMAVAWNGTALNKAKLKKVLKQNEVKISGHKPYRHRIQDAWKIFKRALAELYFRHEIRFFE